MLPRVVVTPKSKGKGKEKAREEEEEKFVISLNPLLALGTNSRYIYQQKKLANLLHWQKALTVVDTGMGAGVVLKKAKGKKMVLPEESATTAGPTTIQKGAGTPLASNLAIAAIAQEKARAFVEWQRELAAIKEPIQIKHLSLNLPTLHDGIVVGGSGVAKDKQQEKSREIVESEDEASNKESTSNSDNSNNVPLAHKWAASPALFASTKPQRTVTSKEEGGDKMEQGTPMAIVDEVEMVASGGVGG
ncbi:hypothetical protein C0989_009980 [Termitomyces sp. Mn162]|nr:hypothetical protein C0989_009980 [Termitomyces sp. Mn162]